MTEQATDFEKTYKEQIEQQRKNILDAYNGQVDTYDTDEMTTKFKVIAFTHGFVTVERREDGQKGSLQFIHDPRVYYHFMPHE